jgi:hypothetical protein
MAFRWTFLGIALFAAGVAAPAMAMRQAPETLCRDAAISASRQTGVPLQVLLAISLTETGRKGENGFSPWPWTLNIEGRGEWLDNRGSALEMAYATLRRGARSFDVGCFQVNYRWHGEGFTSLEQMMDPEANALYAARFLLSLYDETGDWALAAGHYHSRTPEHASRYRRVFERHMASVSDSPLPPQQVAQLGRENRFPLLQPSGGERRMGSLVPALAGSGPGLLTSAPRPFWSGS